MNDNLPPLPFSPYLYTEWKTPSDRVSSTMFTEEQKLEYGQLCRQQALEEIAVVFDANESYRLLAKFIRSMK